MLCIYREQRPESKFSGKGRVSEQSLDAGSKFLPDETIEIKLN